MNRLYNFGVVIMIIAIGLMFLLLLVNDPSAVRQHRRDGWSNR